MANHVYIAKSLDGFIADKEFGLDWLFAVPNPDNSDLGFLEFIDQIDAIVMGRRTFETVCSFGGEWPYPRPVFVLSETLNSVPEEFKDQAELVSGSLKEIVSGLSERGYNELYIDGGKTIQSFLNEDMIDELIISTIPVLLGGGVTLFGDLSEQQEFKHMSTKTLIDEIVQSRYTRKKQ